MTTSQAACAEQAALEKTMLFDGFLGVAGTGGIETAVTGHHGTDGVAVNLDQSERDATHGMTGVRGHVSGFLRPIL